MLANVSGKRDKFPSYFLLDNADFDKSLWTDANLFTAK